jgi:hypothetical protein
MMRTRQASLLLLLLPAAVWAQGDEARVEGVIVSVRADVLQVRPRYSTQLTRVLLDDKTEIRKGEMVGLDKIEAGTLLFGFGEVDEKGGLTPRFLQVVVERTGFFGGKLRGPRGTGYGRSAMFGGTVKSVKPLTLTDDDGKEMTLTLGPFVPILRQGKTGREALLVGQSIGAEGKKTTDGLVHAEQIEIQQFPGGGPGGDGGAIFGKVVSVQGGTVEVRPRFGDATIQATLAENASLQRQVTVDPESVKIGDNLTVQGRLVEGSTSAPARVTASVLLLGKQSYPKASSGGFFAMVMGGGRGDVTCTGTVASLNPFVLTLAAGSGPGEPTRGPTVGIGSADGGLPGGSSVTVTIPGQVPVVELRPVTLAELKPGDRILLVGAEGKEGGMVAKTLVLGASPIVGFGG